MTEVRIIRSGKGGELIGPHEVVEIDGSHTGAVEVEGRLTVRPGCRQDGAVRVLKGGTLQIDGTQVGSLWVEGNATVGSQGHVTGSVTVDRGASLRVDGSAEGTIVVEEGGELTIGPSGLHSGAGMNYGKITNAGRLDSDIGGNAPIEGPAG